jgi:hypothetical protein
MLSEKIIEAVSYANDVHIRTYAQRDSNPLYFPFNGGCQFSYGRRRK